MTKDYPLRPREQEYNGAIEYMCECGHNQHAHDTSNMVYLTNPPQYDYLQCRTCMCPKYKFEKSYKQYLPQ